MDKPTWLDGKTIKAVVLPTEHGSWAYVLEPILFGCLWVQNGSWRCGLGLFLLFLCLRPCLLTLRDLRAHKSYPRTWVAIVAAMLLGAGGLALVFLPAIQMGFSTTFRTLQLLGLMGLGLTISEFIKQRTSADNPFRLVFVLLTVALMLPLIRVQDGVPSEWGGYAFVLFRSIPSFLYVRCRLKRVAFHDPHSNLAIWAVLASSVPVLFSLNPLLFWRPHPAVVAQCLWYWVLLGRAIHGLQPHLVGTRTPRQVGLAEAGYGAFWVALHAWSMRAIDVMH